MYVFPRNPLCVCVCGNIIFNSCTTGASWCINLHIKDMAAEALNMQQHRNKGTHGESRAGWDVRGIEGEHSPSGRDVETLAVSLQQHGAVVGSCRGLETPATLETWKRRDEERLLMKVTFCSLLTASATSVYAKQLQMSLKKTHHRRPHNTGALKRLNRRNRGLVKF